MTKRYQWPAMAKRLKSAKRAYLICKAAAELLDRLDNMTTEEFKVGGERAEREALREVLESINREDGTPERFEDTLASRTKRNMERMTPYLIEGKS